MSRVCELCGRHTRFGNQVTKRGLAKYKGGVGRKITGITRRAFKPNIQNVRAVINGETRRVKVCASCIRSGKIQKPA